MNSYIFSDYQKGQLKVITDIEEQIKRDSLKFSVVTPTADFNNDPRIALTSVHFPHEDLKTYILESLQKPLQTVQPNHFYYPSPSLHLTIKNIRVINDPPHFTAEDVATATAVFQNILPKHTRFNAYFFRLLTFKYNLALVGTTDPELDRIILNLDDELNNAGVPDDKIYANSDHFFAMMTIARFQQELSDEFRSKIEELSLAISFPNYTIDSIALISCNAVLNSKEIHGEWELGS